MIYMPYWASYLEDLGILLTEICLLFSLQRSQQLLLTLPGGILADRIGRKKVTLIGAATNMITPLIYLIAGSMELLVVGTISSSPQSVSMAAYDAMVAESLPRDQMGSGSIEGFGVES